MNKSFSVSNTRPDPAVLIEDALSSLVGPARKILDEKQKRYDESSDEDRRLKQGIDDLRNIFGERLTDTVFTAEDDSEEFTLPQACSKDDLDFSLAELKISLTRGGKNFINQLPVYIRGLTVMLFVFQRMGNTKADAVVNFLKNIIELLRAIRDFAPLPIERVQCIKEVFSEYKVEAKEFQSLDSAVEDAKRPQHVFADTFDASGGNNVTERRGLIEEYYAMMHGDDDIYKDDDGLIECDDPDQSFDEDFNEYTSRHLFYIVAGIIQNGTVFRFIDAVIRKDSNGSDIEIKKEYQKALQLLSMVLENKDKRRKVRDLPKTLHSEKTDANNFFSALENGGLPEKLWRQQDEVLQAIQCGLKKGLTRMYFEKPAGTGKTLDLVLLATLLNPDGNTLILTPNIQLCMQTQEVFLKESDRRDIGLVAADKAVFDQPITIGTYQSFQRYVRKEIFPGDKYSLILLDEAHRSLSHQREGVIDFFHDATIIGSTASSEDIHGRSVSDTLKRVYYMSLMDGIKAGIVNPMRIHKVPIPGNYKALDNTAVEQDFKMRVNILFALYKKHCENKQAIIMMNTIKRAEDAAQYFNDQRIRARTIHSRMDSIQAANLDRAFRKGEFPVLCVCDMLTEGWDYPELEFEFLGDQLTKEWQVLQRIGRVSRKVPGKGISEVFELCGGIGRESFTTRDESIISLPYKTSLDDIFNLNGFSKDGTLIPSQDGYWPKNVFEI